MEDLVQAAARQIALAINVIAIMVVVGGVLQAIVGLLGAMAARTMTLIVKRALWLDLARWLIAGLTFQLAADVVETAVLPSWEALGQFAAVAVIRTLLSYSLGRDLDAIAARQGDDGANEAKRLSS